LPLPCTEDITPVVDAYSNHDGREGELKDFNGFYFTMPIEHFHPSPCKLSDVSDTQNGQHMLTMLSIVFNIVSKMFYGSRRQVISLPNGGGRRVRVFMEYLVDEDSDDTDMRVIDALGIRFHIHVYDQDLNMMDALMGMVDENGGAVKSGGDDADNDMESDLLGPVGGKKPKKQKKTDKKKTDKKKKGPPKAYELWEGVNNMIKWFTCANAYLKYAVNRTNFTVDTHGDEKYLPHPHHPLFPDNVFSWENSFVDGMRDSQKASTKVFGLPSLVYELPWHLLSNNLAIMAMILPGTPLWYSQSHDEMVNTLQTFINVPCLETYFSSRFVKRNDLKELLEVQNAKIKKIEAKTAAADLPKELLRFRRRTVKYVAKAWKPGSTVSEPIKIMAKWAKEEKTWTTAPQQVVDPKMTYFGNMMAADMLHLEKDMRISTTHTVLLRVLINGLGCYRYKLDLHNNVIMMGQGATGKSHILDTIAEMLIDGTTSKVSHSTDKAATIDTDNNDHISLFHEMPPGLMGSDRSGAETGNHIIKDMMTSCQVVTVSIHVDNDVGRRVATKFISECVGVILACTNERGDKIPEALATRMIKIIVNEYLRTKFSVNEMTSDIVGIDGEEEREDGPTPKEIFFRKWRVRQLMCNMVEKMIYTKTLVDVDMSVFNLMQMKMTKYMKDHDIMYKSGNIRDIRFMRHFARTLTILYACDRFANDPRSPGYKKIMSFNVLQDIQPYLFCTEEIALFTLTLNADQLIQIHHFKLMEVLLYAVKKNLQPNVNGTPDIKNGYYYTKACYKDQRVIYNHLVEAQSSGNFTEKMSQENLKTAFNEIRRQCHNSYPIVQFVAGTDSIFINKDYVDKHFEMDNNLGRYVCKFNLNSIMEDVFFESYCNTFTKEHERMLLGTIIDREAPFLFNTMHKKTNPKHVLTHDIAQSVDNGKTPHSVESTYYDRCGSTVKYKINFESFAWREYMRKCGLDHRIEELEPHILHETIENTGQCQKVYPTDYCQWFETFTGVKTNFIQTGSKKRKLS
jgi:hypothetical protein